MLQPCTLYWSGMHCGGSSKVAVGIPAGGCCSICAHFVIVKCVLLYRFVINSFAINCFAINCFFAFEY